LLKRVTRNVQMVGVRLPAEAHAELPRRGAIGAMRTCWCSFTSRAGACGCRQRRFIPRGAERRTRRSRSARHRRTRFTRCASGSTIATPSSSARSTRPCASAASSRFRCACGHPISTPTRNGSSRHCSRGVDQLPVHNSLRTSLSAGARWSRPDFLGGIGVFRRSRLLTSDGAALSIPNSFLGVPNRTT